MFIFIFIILLILNFNITENLELSDYSSKDIEDGARYLVPILNLLTGLDSIAKKIDDKKSLIALKKQEINIKHRKIKLKKIYRRNKR